MEVGRLTVLLILFSNLLPAHSSGSIRLPLDSLRSQKGTMHCWAYAMSHLLESRAALRESNFVMFDVETDTKYWVDYERLWSVYRMNSDVYIGNVELGWQMEFWEALLKHGRALYRTAHGSSEAGYPLLTPFFSPWGFIAGSSSHTPGASAIPPAAIKQRIQIGGFANEFEVDDFITHSLDQWYGRPQNATQWFGKTIALEETPSYVLGIDFAPAKLESFVLIKPVSDNEYGWVKYLDERYWGYRYNAKSALSLIDRSLDSHWPVSFDNSRHAMTIVGYEKGASETHYAVADSIGSKITWITGRKLLPSLNLLTIFHATVADLLPPIPSHSFKSTIDYDRRDNTHRPLCR